MGRRAGRVTEGGRYREGRHLAGTALPGLPAAGAEAAAGGDVRRGRHVSGEDDPLAVFAGLRVGDRHRREQCLGVGVGGVLVDLGVPSDLHDPAQVHDADPVGDVPDHGQVVGDEDVGEVELRLEAVQQVDHLGLHRDVQRGHRLVGDDHLRAQRKPPCDADALALAAGELVRIAVDVLRVEADHVQQLLDPAAAVALRCHFGVDVVRLPDDVPDRHTGVEGRVRVLEDHLDVAADRLEGPAGQPGDVLALEQDGAGRRALQAAEQLRDRRLAAARLPDDAEGLAPAEGEVDAVDGLHRADLLPEQDALGEGVVLDQPGHFEDRLSGHGHPGTPSRSGRRCRVRRRPRTAGVRRCGRRPWPSGSAGGRSSRAGCPSGSAGGP